jgi:hypothetical protein
MPVDDEHDHKQEAPLGSRCSGFSAGSDIGFKAANGYVGSAAAVLGIRSFF